MLSYSFIRMITKNCLSDLLNTLTLFFDCEMTIIHTFHDKSWLWYYFFLPFFLISRDDLGFRLISEQVSHHPPISAFHAEGLNNDFIFHGSIYPKLKFWGKSVEAEPKGTITLELLEWVGIKSFNFFSCSPTHLYTCTQIWPLCSEAGEKLLLQSINYLLVFKRIWEMWQ